MLKDTLYSKVKSIEAYDNRNIQIEALFSVLQMVEAYLHPINTARLWFSKNGFS